jgi:hypothetical protein
MLGLGGCIHYMISISEKSNQVQMNTYGFRQNSSEYIQRWLRLYIDAVQTVSIVLQMDLHLFLTCTLPSPCSYPRESMSLDTHQLCFFPLVPKFFPLFQTPFRWCSEAVPVSSAILPPSKRRYSTPNEHSHTLFCLSYSLQRKDGAQ